MTRVHLSAAPGVGVADFDLQGRAAEGEALAIRAGALARHHRIMVVIL